MHRLALLPFPMTTPVAVLIAGPNGAGKTTFARQFLPVLHPGVPFLNADEIQRESAQLAAAAAAARELIIRLDAAERAGESFAVETTLASKSYATRVRHWSELGFTTVLHFIELASADVAVARVQARVSKGGHSIPEDDIRRRFDRGRRLFLELYKNLFDFSCHWFSDEDGLRLLSEYSRVQAL